MTPRKAMQITSSIIVIWGTALALYGLTSGQWILAAITAFMVGVNLWCAIKNASED